MSFCVFSAAVKSGGAASFNLAVNGFVQSLERPPLTVAMIIITRSVEWFVLVPATFLLLALPKTRCPLGIPAAVVLTLSGVLNFLLKLLFAVPRPEIHRLAEVTADYAFPSGHSMTSAAFVCACAYLLLRFDFKPPAKFAIIAGAALWVMAVGISRVYLGVHNTADVLAGWVAGVFVCALVIIVTDALGFSYNES